MDVPEGMMLITDHQEAMAALRAELSEAINTKQAEIDGLLQRADAEAQALIDAATADRDAAIEALRVMTLDRDSNATDNAALRAGFSSYMVNSALGQEALRQFQVGLIDDQMAALQGRRTALVGGG